MKSEQEITDKIKSLESGIVSAKAINNISNTEAAEECRTFCEIGIGILKWVLR